MISVIVAKDKLNGIGKDNKLPWKLSDDLKHFKEMTKNNVVIMGRKTFESIGKPLPGRENIVITKSDSWSSTGIITVSSIDEAITLCKTHFPNKECFVIGGASIYNQIINYGIKRYIITEIDTVANCDTFFPNVDLTKYYKAYEKYIPKNQSNEYDFVIKEYRK